MSLNINGTYYLIILLAFLFIQKLNAQNSSWVSANGSSVGANITDVEGRKLALEAARAEAIKQVVGLQITELTYFKLVESSYGNKHELFDVFARLSQSNSFGRILEEIVLREWTEIENNIPIYKVEIKALVAEDFGQVDPNFEVKVIMPKDVFYAEDDKDGEELKFNIWASQDCYLYVFNIMANDSIQILFPNRYIKDHHYIANKSKQEYEKVLDNLSFTVSLPKGKEQTLEALYVVGTKDKLSFNKYDENSSGIPSTFKAAIEDIQKWLIKIPRNKRTENLSSYEIRKK